MLKRCCKEDVCMLLLCMWWLVCGLCVCVSIWRPQRKTENGRQIKHLCTACICVGGFAWSHLNSRFYAFNSLRFTSKRQKETDTKICIRTNVFVIKCIFFQRLMSKINACERKTGAHWSSLQWWVTNIPEIKPDQRLSILNISCCMFSLCGYDRISWLL